MHFILLIVSEDLPIIPEDEQKKSTVGTHYLQEFTVLLGTRKKGKREKKELETKSSSHRAVKNQCMRYRVAQCRKA